MKRLFFLLLVTVTIASCKKTKDCCVEPPVQTADLPAGAHDGVTFINGGTSAIITLYAPGKSAVSVIGEFNNWESFATPMTLTPDLKTWWVKIDNLDPNAEYAYQFLVDGNLKVADPYCEKILDPNNDGYISTTTYPALKTYPTGKTTGIVSIMQADQPTYTWKNSGFVRPDKNKLVIYELLVRDFTPEHNYASTLQKLDYLKGLGINAIELMPVNEFEGNSSWGYNPSFYFAPDKYYGTKMALQNFIDECHGKGIAVILDMVLEHSFGQSPMVQLYYDGSKPSLKSPWYNAYAKHPLTVGFDFNHESEATKYFSKNVMKFWMQQYKIDGFRFDFSKGFTQKMTSDVSTFSAYDESRIAIWREYNNYIKTLDRDNFYVILEHFATGSEETVLADEGMMLWNNLNYPMNEATMGWLNNSNFSWAFFGNRGLTKSDNLLDYIESHDEERLNFKNQSFGNVSGTYSIKGNLVTSLKREEMAAAFLFSIPGPKMIWQFGELGYDISIDENGRTGEKPVKWDYFDDANRKALYNAYAQFIHLKENNDVFNTQSYNFDLTGGVKYIKLNSAGNTVVVVGNFDVIPQTANIDFGSNGSWFDFGSSSISLPTGTYANQLAPGEYHIFSKAALN